MRRCDVGGRPYLTNPLTYNNAHAISGSNRVKVYTVVSGGLSGVSVESFHTSRLAGLKALR